MGKILLSALEASYKLEKGIVCCGLLVCWVNFYKLPSSQEFPAFLWFLPSLCDCYTNTEKFSVNPVKNHTHVMCFHCLAGKLSQLVHRLCCCEQNKYIVNLQFGLWNLHEKRNTWKIFAILDYIWCSSVISFPAWWQLVPVSTVFCCCWKWPVQTRVPRRSVPVYILPS